MIKLEIEIPDAMAMELNAHIATFKAQLGTDISVTDMIVSALAGYLIDHANNILGYRQARLVRQYHDKGDLK